MNIYTFLFSPFKLQKKPIINLFFLTLNMIKIGMIVEVYNALLSFHLHIEHNHGQPTNVAGCREGASKLLWQMATAFIAGWLGVPNL
jgi:hypothetical protein